MYLMVTVKLSIPYVQFSVSSKPFIFILITIHFGILFKERFTLTEKKIIDINDKIRR